MLPAAPCPVCGEQIRPCLGGGRGFDCPNGCRARDREGWDAARAAQLAAEIDALLHPEPDHPPDEHTAGQADP